MDARRAQTWRRRALAAMERTRAATLRLLSRIPERELARRPKNWRTQGRWSAKDTFVHIVAWEAEAVRRLLLIERGRGRRIFFYDDPRDVDRFNARAVRRARRESWKALIRRAERVRKRLGEGVARLPAAAIDDPTHRYPVSAWLPEFAWTHERDHLRRLRASPWRRSRTAR